MLFTSVSLCFHFLLALTSRCEHFDLRWFFIALFPICFHSEVAFVSLWFSIVLFRCQVEFVECAEISSFIRFEVALVTHELLCDFLLISLWFDFDFALVWL